MKKEAEKCLLYGKMRPMVVCRKCNKRKPHSGRGLCHVCLTRENRKRRIDEKWEDSGAV